MSRTVNLEVMNYEETIHNLNEPIHNIEEMTTLDMNEPINNIEEMTTLDMNEPIHNIEEMTTLDMNEPINNIEEMTTLDMNEPINNIEETTPKLKKFKFKNKNTKPTITFNDIKPIIWSVQNDLRNKEGITGMSAMHHINMVLLAKTFTTSKCRELNIDTELSYENIKDLNETDLYIKFYNKENQQKCIVYWIRYNKQFGYSKDIPFEIKQASTLHSMFSKLDKMNSKDIFSQIDLIGDIYEHFINREGKTMKDLGQYFTDRTLINYLVDMTRPILLENGQIETVYDPASGTGGFLTQYIHYYNKNNSVDWSKNIDNIYAGDINMNTYVLLKLNLYFSTGYIGEKLVLGDSLTTDVPLESGFDVILMNPPFGVKGLKHKDMNSKIKDLNINGTKGEILFLQQAMVNLKRGGRCCIVVPDGVLFNSTKMYKHTRKYLLEHFQLEKVIKVGEGEFFKNTGVKTAVLFFRNTGEKTLQVDFVQVNKVNGRIEEVPLLTVEMDKIMENDYSLNMNLYKEVVFGECNDFDMVKIEDIITEFKSGKYIPNTNGTLYPYYNSNGIIGNMDTFMFDGEYIIQATSGSNINENTFYYNGKFNATNFTTIFKTKANCLVKYLYYFIRIKLNIREQCCNGSTIPNLDKKSFVRIKIPLPPLNIQHQIVNQLDNIYENEIENSKKTIEGLEKSIEGMMKNTMMRSDLEEYRIDEVCDLQPGKRITKKNDEGTLYNVYGGSSKPYYKTDGFNREGDNITLCVHGAHDKYVIFTTDKIWQHDDGTTINIKNDDKLSKYYLYLLLSSMSNILQLGYQGATRKHMNIDYFKNIKIHLPPLNIQNQIVEQVNQKENLINLLKENMNHAVSQANDSMSQLFTN